MLISVTLLLTFMTISSWYMTIVTAYVKKDYKTFCKKYKHFHCSKFVLLHFTTH